jgi:hypothetical protein
MVITNQPTKQDLVRPPVQNPSLPAPLPDAETAFNVPINIAGINQPVRAPVNGTNITRGPENYGVIERKYLDKTLGTFDQNLNLGELRNQRLHIRKRNQIGKQIVDEAWEL